MTKSYHVLYVYRLCHFGAASSSRFPFRANRNPRLGFGFDLLNSGSAHAKVLPWTVCLLTLVLTARAVFLLERRQTDMRLNAIPPCQWLYSRRG